MRKTLVSATVALVVLFTAIGCATFSSNTFRAEQVAASLADTGMKVWADYYSAARANPAAFGITNIVGLDAQRVQIDQLSVKVGTSIQTLDKLRADYVAGLVDKSAVQSALATVSKNADVIIVTIKLFLPPAQQTLIK